MPSWTARRETSTSCSRGATTVMGLPLDDHYTPHLKTTAAPVMHNECGAVQCRKQPFADTVEEKLMRSHWLSHFGMGASNMIGKKKTQLRSSVLICWFAGGGVYHVLKSCTRWHCFCFHQKISHSKKLNAVVWRVKKIIREICEGTSSSLPLSVHLLSPLWSLFHHSSSLVVKKNMYRIKVTGRLASPHTNAALSWRSTNMRVTMLKMTASGLSSKRACWNCASLYGFMCASNTLNITGY